MVRVFVLHPLLRPDRVEARDYQVRLAQVAHDQPSLVVLPTGLGKTIIALLASVRYLERSSDGRILVLAPTKPLVEQHAQVFRDCLLDVPVVAFTGDTSPAERDRAWGRARVVVCTPQVVENDIIRGARDLRGVSFLVFDEAHRGVGNYPYSFIARRYRDVGGRAALGLTASPGSDLGKIQAILHHLGLERVEVRTEADADVKPYLHPVAIEWIRVKPTPTLIRVIQLLTRVYLRTAAQLRRLGYLQGIRGVPNRKELLELGQRIRAEAAASRGRRSVFEAATVQARALKIQHALELVETQGLSALAGFLSRVHAEAEQAGGTRAARDFAREPEFGEALAVARATTEPHPKVARLLEVVAKQLEAGARRILVFANFRETAELIVHGLSMVPNCRAHRFVGHGASQGERGLTKKAQQEVVGKFRAGAYNVLVATSVAEEGLDLPETDAVVLYEPVPSGIRMIQRRGRTGRRGAGRMFVLLTEGTRDEQYHWAALRREKRMHEELVFLQRTPARQTLSPAIVPVPAPLLVPTPASQGMEVVVDARESAGPVPRRLLERGALLKTSNLALGDYVVGSRLFVERKSCTDFVASLRDGRLFDQAKRLAATGHGVLVVEGDQAEILAHIPAAAYYGAVASIVADHGLSVVQVPDASGTADFLLALSRREKNQGAGLVPSRFQKRQSSAAEELRFVLEGLPSVGPVLADRLLGRFGSLSGVATATVADLERVEGVGMERARTLHEVLHRDYQDESRASGIAQGPRLEMLAPKGGDGAARGQGSQPGPITEVKPLEQPPSVHLGAPEHA